MNKIPVALLLTILACLHFLTGEDITGKASLDYPITPVPVTRVKINDGFWSVKLETNRTVTIPSSFRKCEETGRVDNFSIAAGIREGGFQSKYPFDDSDVYKIMEGASYSLAAHPDPELEKYLDDLIATIAMAQEKDGYLMTWRSIDPNKPPTDWSGDERWANTLNGHELYNAGHLYEAAVAHFQATGKRTFLDIALKNAGLIIETFGPGKLMMPPGHEEIEIGLVKLYRVTSDRKYLDLAEFFIDQRGNSKGHEPYGETYQDHIPVREQEEAVGHAVRAAYLYSGMADVAALTGNEGYLKALEKIWENLVNRKLYITGGIGSIRGDEAFGRDYSLPNETAYNETCAAIANIFWNQRMFLLKGDAAYIDVLERTLYNNMPAGVSLGGDTFFYPNILEFDGREAFNYGIAGRSEWFNCSCCPSNVSRFIPSIPGYIYSTRDDTIFINLYIGNEAEIPMQGSLVGIEQRTAYPWNGSVRIKVDPGKATRFSLKLRIPGWAVNRPVPGNLYSYMNPGPGTFRVSVNGKEVRPETERGYQTISRTWKNDDVIQLDIPMPALLVRAHENVEADAGKVAVQRGPVVYCAEAVDNNGSALDLAIPGNALFQERFEENTLQGTMFLTAGRGKRKVTLVPYHAWANRKIGEMKVWFPLE